MQHLHPNICVHEAQNVPVLGEIVTNKFNYMFIIVVIVVLY